MRTHVSRTWLTETGQTMATGRTYYGPTSWHYTVRFSDGGSYSIGGFDSQYLARCAGAAFVASWERKSPSVRGRIGRRA